MSDLFVVLGFIAMVLAPCLVAIGTGVHSIPEPEPREGSERGEWQRCS